MKKAYINPEMVIVEIQTQQMLAASPNGAYNQVGGGTQLAPELDFDPVDIDNLLK